MTVRKSPHSSKEISYSVTIACGGCAGDAGQLGMHDKISRSLAVGEHRVRTKGHTLLFGDGRPGMKCLTVF